MTDEEGGAVQRMANLVGSIPSARTMGATMTSAQIQALATTVAQRMRAAGITMDLAPVLDLDDGNGPNDRDPDGTRSFSLNANTTAADAAAFAAGLAAGGVIPVVKHFPGLGQATANTDVKPATTLPWTTLEHAGLLPFKSRDRGGRARSDDRQRQRPRIDDLAGEHLAKRDHRRAARPARVSGAGDDGFAVSRSARRHRLHGAESSRRRDRGGCGHGAVHGSLRRSVASLTSSTVAALVAAVGAGTLDRSTARERGRRTSSPSRTWTSAPG